MKKNIIILVVISFSFLISNYTIAQSDTTRRTKLFSVSGVGYGFTSGSINPILKPRFSSNLGIELIPKDGSFFISAVADILSFDYNQNYTEKAQEPYRIKNGNSTFYLLEVTPGYRKHFKHISLYGYAGPGVGLINLPNAAVNNTQQTATMVNNYSWTASAKAGLGIDYSLGGFVVFLQGGYIHNFSKVQNQNVNIFPAYLGLKSNITGILTFLGGK
ncbi:MAG: hypothetical protein EOP42_21010 [Sphingobacteriaceae bacterium]|nr:MAG: hypothetical protein EOP42_21010 [Sphingobacteriaceae bacterium]